jgi:23S rRNA (cytidine1920-2'-O)/16S rRNA (cytidine1409-2'-O)-methyltransferase
MGKERLDTRLVASGLVPTRSRARDLIQRGFVSVDGAVCEKPSREIDVTSRLTVSDQAPAFVSRGAEKLVAALDHFRLPVEGRIALDIGASTGGFTQVLLQRGAHKVYAVDVGTAQLHPSLLSDPRITAIEQRDARTLTRDMIPDAAGVIVADVSFISLTKVLPPALRLSAPGCSLIALIKPQFEVGPSLVGKGGIVRDAAARKAAIDAVAAFLAAQPGWRVLEPIVSPILGGSGNEEYLIGARRDD